MTRRVQQRLRAEWGTISRDKLVSAALEEIRAGRYEELTIRSLAAKLGVAPMSLYRHVESRDDLLEAVTDHLLAENWRPPEHPANARLWIEAAALRLRHLLVAEPAALHTALSQPLTTPAALDRRQAMLAVMESAGVGAADQAWAAVQTYVVGFAAIEAGRARWLAERDRTDPDWLADMTSDRQFAHGLESLLDGVGIR
jgi:TetR/AcrR family tetracycline transcriptional repressor